MTIIIPGIFFILSLGGLIFFAVRYWPQLQALDAESLPETRDQQTKNSILEDRLRRKLLAIFEKFWQHIRPVLVKFKNLVRQLYHKLLEKERYLREVSEKVNFQNKAEHEKQVLINSKLEEAEAVDRDQETLEQKYLEILSLDPRNTAAYHGLAELYLKQRDFFHAREVYEYIIKLVGEHVDYLIDIATCWRGEENYIEAFKLLQKALKQEPKNPKIIDMLVETAILMRDFVMAKSYLQLLRTVNPQNKKISEFKSQIDKIKAAV